METALVPFNGTNGSAPYGELIQGADGQLYGTTDQGGPFGDGAPFSGYGTIFKTTLGGSLTTLFSFDGTNGASPLLTPLHAGDGSMYGITFGGGPGGQGTIYQISSNGVLNTLFAFSGTNGGQPTGGLTFGCEGNLYGTTFSGGVFTNDPNNNFAGDGTVFKLTTNGQFTLLTSFNGTNGEAPVALVLGRDGNFYGVTENGGAYGYGTVFQMTTNGNVTSLFSFAGTNGVAPSTLIQGSDGALYGTTLYGGNGFGITNFPDIDGYGTVFRITTNGNFSELALFNSTDGAEPEGRLLEVTNGVFYGITVEGGVPGFSETADGTLFQVTSNGDLTLLLTFLGSFQLPSEPAGGLIKATDGNYYGVALHSPFTGDDGGLYAIRPIQPPVVQASSQGNQINLTWNEWAGYWYSLVSRTNLTDANINDFNVVYRTLTAENCSITYTDIIGPDPQRFYQVVLDGEVQ